MPSIIRSALLVLSVVVLPHLVEGFGGGAEATLEEFYEASQSVKRFKSILGLHTL